MKAKTDLDLYAMILCAIGAAYLIGSKVISETTNMIDITKPIIIPGVAKNRPVAMPGKNGPITILDGSGQARRGRVGEFSVNGVKFYSDTYNVLQLDAIRDVYVNPDVPIAEKKKQQKIVSRLLKVINKEKHIKSEFGKHIRELLQQDKYDELDKLAAQLLETKDRFPSGEWKLYHFYIEIKKDINKRDIAAYLKRITEIKKWVSSNPDSYVAKITLMGLFRDLALAYREIGDFKNVSNKGAENYKAAVNTTIEIGNVLRSSQVKDPALYVYLISASNHAGVKKDKIKDLAKESFLISPLYFHSYNATMAYLLPRWGGAPGEIEEFSNSIFKISKDTVGAEFYFRAVRTAKLNLNDRIFDRFHFDWKIMKLGFSDYRKRYQTLDSDIHLMARLACLYGDREAGKNYFLETDGQWNHFAKAVWDNPEVLEQFKTWANEKPDGEFTKLLYAMLEEKYPVVTVLVKEYIKYGGDIDKKDVYGNTLLHKAVRSGQYDLAEILIAVGADVNLPNRYGYSPIHLAAQGGFKELTKLLVINGADITAQTKKHHTTAVYIAARSGSKQVVLYLLEEKPSLINVGDRYGGTPLHVASFEGHINVVKALLSSSELRLNNQTFYGDTAIHKALYHGHYEVIALLVKSGVNPNIKNRKSHSALSLAKEKGLKKIAALLQKENADDSSSVITVVASQKALELFKQGAQFDNKKEYQKAKALYLEALKFDPNYFLAYNALAGGSWNFENDLEQADKYMRKSLELNPFYAESYYWRGRINHILNKPEVYKPMFLKYIELAPHTYNTKDLVQNYSYLLK